MFILKSVRLSLMKIDKRLVDSAITLMETRFPRGQGGAAAMYTEDGEILTSIGVENQLNDSANLCHETGAILEALKLGKRITASVCVFRETETKQILILTPCGICQERLMPFGDNLEVAVPKKSDPTQWESKTLKEVQPYYWGKVFKK